MCAIVGDPARDDRVRVGEGHGRLDEPDLQALLLEERLERVAGSGAVCLRRNSGMFPDLNARLGRSVVADLDQRRPSGGLAGLLPGPVAARRHRDSMAVAELGEAAIGQSPLARQNLDRCPPDGVVELPARERDAVFLHLPLHERGHAGQGLELARPCGGAALDSAERNGRLQTRFRRRMLRSERADHTGESACLSMICGSRGLTKVNNRPLLTRWARIPEMRHAFAICERGDRGAGESNLAFHNARAASETRATTPYSEVNGAGSQMVESQKSQLAIMQLFRRRR